MRPTRAATPGVIDYVDRWWTFRFAEAMLSKRANGLNLQKNLQDAHSENFEFEFRPNLLSGRDTAVRALAFTNYANMGDYHQAIDLFTEGKEASPEITAHPQQRGAQVRLCDQCRARLHRVFARVPSCGMERRPA